MRIQLTNIINTDSVLDRYLLFDGDWRFDFIITYHFNPDHIRININKTYNYVL